MKKTYSKPYLAVESFQLDAAVANSCSSEQKMAINANIDTCNFSRIDPNITQFGAACPINVLVTYGEHNTFCYHGPLVDLNTIAIYS